MKQLRRTKIIATLGPASEKPEVLEKLITEGVDVVRLNFSHGKAEDHAKRAQLIRQTSKKLAKEIAIVADLQGPKIRVSTFKNKEVMLKIGQDFCLDPRLAPGEGDDKQVGITYKNLANDLMVGDTLLLDDGLIVLKVEHITGTKIDCSVTVGGVLSDNKGINRLGGGLSAESLTEKDKQDLKSAVAIGVDYIAVSFPRCAKDIDNARELLKAENSNAGIIAKIERAEAISVIDEIIHAADAVMVARGDLGVEIGDAELPEAQKHIIHQARALNKAVITATQMMESMRTNIIPTRAEVFDVANAVLDGTDAVMLSAETATGVYPVETVQAMVRACLASERNRRTQVSGHRMGFEFERIDESIAMASMYIANHLDIKGIICLTESGSTPLLMSRIRSGIPIFGLTRNLDTQRKMALYRGVYPIAFDPSSVSRHDLNTAAIECLQQLGYVEKGHRIIITKGSSIGVHGHTNALKIITVGD